MPEDTRQVTPETPHLALPPHRPPPPSLDELAAIKALFKGKATEGQQAHFVIYLMGMCGIGQSEFGQGEFWAFTGGKRWVATTLMAMAEVRMVPLGLRKVLEKETDG